MSNQELLQVYSAYLPHGVKVMFEGEELEHSLVGLDTTSTPLKLISSYGDYGQASFEFSKIILRPLSDLCQKIQVEGEETTWLEHLLNKNPRYFNYLTYKPMFNNYWEFESLVKNHFDVFGLLNKNLAINLNEVK